MTITVTNVKETIMLELESYKIYEDKNEAEFITINGRSGKLIPYGKNDKSKKLELQIPVYSKDNQRAIVAEIIWN